MIRLPQYSIPESLITENTNKLLDSGKTISLLSQGKDGWLSIFCFNLGLYLRGISSIPNNTKIEDIQLYMEDIKERIIDQIYVVFTNTNDSPQLDAGDQSAGDKYFNNIIKRASNQGIQIQKIQLPDGPKALKYEVIKNNLLDLFETKPSHGTYRHTLVTGELFGNEQYPETLDILLAEQLQCDTFASYREYFDTDIRGQHDYGERCSGLGPYRSVVFQDHQGVYTPGQKYDYHIATGAGHYDPLGEDGSIQTAIVSGPPVVPVLNDNVYELIKQYISLGMNDTTRNQVLQEIISKSFPMQEIS